MTATMPLSSAARDHQSRRSVDAELARRSGIREATAHFRIHHRERGLIPQLLDVIDAQHAIGGLEAVDRWLDPLDRRRRELASGCAPAPLTGAFIHDHTVPELEAALSRSRYLATLSLDDLEHWRRDLLAEKASIEEEVAAVGAELEARRGLEG